MTRYTFRGQTLLNGLLLVPMIMPPFVGAIGLTQLLARYGSVNLLLMKMGLMDPAAPLDWLGSGGFWGMVLLQVFNLYPVMLLNVSAALANVDPAMREAAQNLGAGPARLFRTVTLPLILPGWFAGAIIVFIWAFTDLGTPLIFGFSQVVPGPDLRLPHRAEHQPARLRAGGLRGPPDPRALRRLQARPRPPQPRDARPRPYRRCHDRRHPAPGRLDLARRRAGGDPRIAAPPRGDPPIGLRPVVPLGPARHADPGSLRRTRGPGLGGCQHPEQPPLLVGQRRARPDPRCRHRLAPHPAPPALRLGPRRACDAAARPARGW
jgi:hypothetical protein